MPSIDFRNFDNLGYDCDGIAAVDNIVTADRYVYVEATGVFDRPRPTSHGTT